MCVTARERTPVEALMHRPRTRQVAVLNPRESNQLMKVNKSGGDASFVSIRDTNC